MSQIRFAPNPYSCGALAIILQVFHTYNMQFLKPANSELENGIQKNSKCPLKKFIYSGNWKLEKTLSERHQNNTAIGVDLKKKTIFIQFFISKRPASFKKQFAFLSCRGSDPFGECPAKNASFVFLRAPSRFLSNFQ